MAILIKNGLIYDTTKATPIHTYDWQSFYGYHYETLFRTQGSRFFLAQGSYKTWAYLWGKRIKEEQINWPMTMTPYNEQEAADWLKAHGQSPSKYGLPEPQVA